MKTSANQKLKEAPFPVDNSNMLGTENLLGSLICHATEAIMNKLTNPTKEQVRDWIEQPVMPTLARYSPTSSLDLRRELGWNLNKSALGRHSTFTHALTITCSSYISRRASCTRG